MNDPRLVEHAQVTPGYCFFCKSVNGPFIDTKVTAPPLQRIYMCAHTCGVQVADLCSSQEIGVRDAEIAALTARVNALLQELADAEAAKVVPASDLQARLEEYLEEAREERRRYQEEWEARLAALDVSKPKRARAAA